MRTVLFRIGRWTGNCSDVDALFAASLLSFGNIPVYMLVGGRLSILSTKRLEMTKKGVWLERAGVHSWSEWEVGILLGGFMLLAMKMGYLFGVNLARKWLS